MQASCSGDCITVLSGIVVEMWQHWLEKVVPRRSEDNLQCPTCFLSGHTRCMLICSCWKAIEVSGMLDPTHIWLQ